MGLSRREYAAAGYELTRAVYLHAPGDQKAAIVDLRSMATEEKADFLYNEGIRRNRPMIGILERRN